MDKGGKNRDTEKFANIRWNIAWFHLKYNSTKMIYQMYTWMHFIYAKQNRDKS